MTVSIELQMEQMGQRAKKAARVLSAAAPAAKTQALRALAALLIERQPDILKANALDVNAAKAANMDAPRLDRLTLTPRIMADMADACLHVAEMADEVGVIEQQWQRPNGLMIGKMRIPLGVIAMIFESRPNVTIDAAILCLKAGDAVILRGGSEAIHSNLALAGLLHEALRSAGLPEDAAQVVETTDRAADAARCKLDKYVDVMIPRGGESLVRAVCEAATMPVLKHYMGVCHLYIDEGADLGMALRLAHNGKVQRPGVCNALECLLVAFVFCMNGFLSGCGCAVFCMAHNLAATFALRIPLSFLFSRMSGDSLYPMGLAAPLASLGSILLCALYLRRLARNPPGGAGDEQHTDGTGA